MLISDALLGAYIGGMHNLDQGSRVPRPRSLLVAHSLLLAEHELGWREEAAQRDLAELLLFEELGDVHAHSQLLVPLLDGAEEFHAAARDYLPEAGAGDAVPGAEFGLNLEIQRLIFDLSLQLLSEVEDVLYDVNFSFQLLIHVDDNVNKNVGCKGQPTSISDQIPHRITRSLNMEAVKSQTDRSCDVRLLFRVGALHQRTQVQ